MKTMLEFFNDILWRREYRLRELKQSHNASQKPVYMLCEILDDMLEQRIQSDKVLEGVLKDIQGGVAQVTAELTVKAS